MQKPRLDVKMRSGEQEQGGECEGGLYLVPAKECSGILLEEEGGEDTGGGGFGKEVEVDREEYATGGKGGGW